MIINICFQMSGSNLMHPCVFLLTKFLFFHICCVNIGAAHDEEPYPQFSQLWSVPLWLNGSSLCKGIQLQEKELGVFTPVWNMLHKVLSTKNAPIYPTWNDITGIATNGLFLFSLNQSFTTFSVSAPFVDSAVCCTVPRSLEAGRDKWFSLMWV